MSHSSMYYEANSIPLVNYRSRSRLAKRFLMIVLEISLVMPREIPMCIVTKTIMNMDLDLDKVFLMLSKTSRKRYRMLIEVDWCVL